MFVAEITTTVVQHGVCCFHLTSCNLSRKHADANERSAERMPWHEDSAMSSLLEREISLVDCDYMN